MTEETKFLITVGKYYITDSGKVHRIVREGTSETTTIYESDRFHTFDRGGMCIICPVGEGLETLIEEVYVIPADSLVSNDRSWEVAGFVSAEIGQAVPNLDLSPKEGADVIEHLKHLFSFVDVLPKNEVGEECSSDKTPGDQTFIVYIEGTAHELTLSGAYRIGQIDMRRRSADKCDTAGFTDPDSLRNSIKKAISDLSIRSPLYLSLAVEQNIGQMDNLMMDRPVGKVPTEVDPALPVNVPNKNARSVFDHIRVQCDPIEEIIRQSEVDFVCLDDLVKGDLVECIGFPCMTNGSIKVVHDNGRGDLYINCVAGRHVLAGGVVDDSLTLPGISKIVLESIK